MKKRTFVVPIIVGFLVLYLFSMGLSTYFMTEHYQAQFDYEYTNVIIDLRESFLNTSDDLLTEVENKTERYKNYMGHLISQTGKKLSSMDYQQYSIAMYDANGNKLAQSGNYIEFYVKSSNKYYYYQLEDYLNDDELKGFMDYYMKLRWHPGSVGSSYLEPMDIYALYGGIEKETGELLALYVTIPLVAENTSSNLQDILYDPYWSWESPKYQAHDHGLLYLTGDYITADQNVIFPFLYNGKKHYDRWLEDEFLQGHPETREFEDVMNNTRTSSVFTVQGETFGNFVFANSSSSENRHWVVLRSTSQPLLAAMDYLKYIYIITFLVMLACMLKVLFTANKTYQEQIALEETRQSFTNMVARDLETPLETIRKLTEGLRVHREEDLNQIIEQTEVIDEMIREMIQVSKQE